MDEKTDKRQAARRPCNAQATIAYYVPVEYEACYGPGCFRSTIVDYNRNGFGVILENELAENTVVNIFPNPQSPAEEGAFLAKVYQSKVKWVKMNRETGEGPFRIGLQHIR